MGYRWNWPAAVCALVLLAGVAVALTLAPLQAAPTKPRAAATAGTVVPLAESFEGGLDSFTSFSIGCATTHCLWGATTTDHHTGTHAAYAADVAEVGDDNLLLVNALAIPANATSAGLTFWHHYDLEYNGGNYYDGGVLEVSTDDGTTWVDAGANITTGGYDGTIATGYSNPLAGRAGWVATTGTTWTQVHVNLLPYRGPSFLLRLRLGTDNSNSTPVTGWWVDDVQVSYAAPLASCARAWTQPAPYPAAVAGPAVVGLDGLVYSFGGQTTTAIAAAYRYDPAADAWAPIAALPVARAFASAVTDGSAIYILGGSDTVGRPTATLWRYDPATNSYVTLASYTTATSGQGAAYLNGHLYRIAGEVDPTQGTSTSTVEVYTVATNLWAAAAIYPQAAFGLAVLPLGGYLYTAGGAQYLGPVAKTYRYDPSTGVWDDGPIADLPGPAAYMAAGLYNGRWLLAAAGIEPNANGVSWDRATNTWSSLDQAPLAVTQAGGAVAGNAFYMVGGIVGVSRTNITQEYAETACATPSPTPAPTHMPSPSPVATTTLSPTPLPSATPSGSPTACPVQFSDVPSGSPFYPYVLCLACRGIVGGYADGSFHVGASVTRGQLAKFVANAAGYADSIPAGQQTFADVPPSNPFWLVVERANAHHVISGYACGRVGEPCPGLYFRPAATVTRGQTAKFVANAAGYADSIPAGQQTFADVPGSSPFWLFVERVALHGIVNGYGCGGAGEPCPGLYYRPAAPVTRGQTAKFISNAFFPNCRTSAMP